MKRAPSGKLEIPKSWRWSKTLVKGVMVGRCVKGTLLSGGYYAHAHTNEYDYYHGWICIRNSVVFEKDETGHNTDRPSQSILHELAHLKTPTANHGIRWARAAIKLGVKPEDDWQVSASIRKHEMKTLRRVT